MGCKNNAKDRNKIQQQRKSYRRKLSQMRCFSGVDRREQTTQLNISPRQKSPSLKVGQETMHLWKQNASDSRERESPANQTTDGGKLVVEQRPEGGHSALRGTRPRTATTSFQLRCVTARARIFSWLPLTFRAVRTARVLRLEPVGVGIAKNGKNKPPAHWLRRPGRGSWGGVDLSFDKQGF